MLWPISPGGLYFPAEIRTKETKKEGPTKPRETKNKSLEKQQTSSGRGRIFSFIALGDGDAVVSDASKPGPLHHLTL